MRDYNETQLSYGNSEDAVRSSWTPRQFGRKQLDDLRSVSMQPAGTPANHDNRRRNSREYTLGEEIANSIIHGIGVALAIAALVLCIVFAVRDGAGLRLVSALVYGISMIMEYLMSTLYHAIPAQGAKRVFRVLHHSAIYLFIAGSYTPFCLITMAGVGGLKLGVFVWAVALVGVAVEAFWVNRPHWVCALIYLLLGWAVLWFIPVLWSSLARTGFWLLLTGGIVYSAGTLFYLLRSVPYMHTVFHVLVVAGSVFQFFSILLYVL